MSLQQTDRYDDIINLPHHRSRMRPHMSIHNRAAQFMPFAALTGYDDIIKQNLRPFQRSSRTRQRSRQSHRRLPPCLTCGGDKKRLFGLVGIVPESNQTKQPLYVRSCVRTLLWMQVRR